MSNTISQEAIGAILKDNEVDAIYNTAVTAVNGLHKVGNMVIDARKDCQSVNDFEIALRKITDAINVCMNDVDVCLGITDKPQPDRVELTADDHFVESSKEAA